LSRDQPRKITYYLSFPYRTYWGLAFYFLFSGLHTLSYARTGVSWLQRWPRALQALHAIFHSTIITLPFLVTIVFWTVLYTNPFFPVRLEAWSNVRPHRPILPLAPSSHPSPPLLLFSPRQIYSPNSPYQITEHALNSLFALLEILLPSTPTPPLLHLPFIVFLLALYLGLAYLTRKTQGFYPYGFLNPSNGKGKVAGYIIGIAVAACVIFGVVWGLIWVRRRLTGAREKRAQRDTGGMCGFGVRTAGEVGLEKGLDEVGGEEVGIDAEMRAVR